MISQEELPLVALSSMNDTHLEELILINHLSKALETEDTKAISSYAEALIAHSVTHFEGEEILMQRYAFPPYPKHKGEHDRALAELRAQVASWHNRRDIASFAYYVNVTLPRWIVQHVQSMDTVTANFLARYES